MTLTKEIKSGIVVSIQPYNNDRNNINRNENKNLSISQSIGNSNIIDTNMAVTILFQIVFRFL